MWRFFNLFSVRGIADSLAATAAWESGKWWLLPGGGVGAVGGVVLSVSLNLPALVVALLALLGLCLGCALVLFGLFLWSRPHAANESTAANRPIPAVVLRQDIYGLSLDVTNEGESAQFRCQVRFAESSEEGAHRVPAPTTRYMAAWVSGATVVTLPRGGSDSLCLGSTERFWRTPIPHTKGVDFPFTRQGGSWFDLHWDSNVTAIKADGRETAMPVGWVVLEVKVLTDPSVAGDVVTKRLRISALGGCEELE